VTLTDKLEYIVKNYPKFEGRVANALASAIDELEKTYFVILEDDDFAAILSYSIGQEYNKFVMHYENDISSLYEIKEIFKKQFDFTLRSRAQSFTSRT